MHCLRNRYILKYRLIIYFIVFFIIYNLRLIRHPIYSLFVANFVNANAKSNWNCSYVFIKIEKITQQSIKFRAKIATLFFQSWDKMATRLILLVYKLLLFRCFASVGCFTRCFSICKKNIKKVILLLFYCVEKLVAGLQVNGNVVTHITKHKES